MGSLVEFIVKMNDLASGPLQRLGNTGQSVFTRLENRARSFRSQFTTIGNSVDQLNQKIADLTRTRNMSIDSSQIRQLNSELDQLQRRRDRLTGDNRSAAGIGSYFRQGLAIAGIGSMALLGKDIMSAGMERQMNQVAFEVLLGKKPGDKVNDQLLNFAKKTIYGNEVFTEGKLLAGSGIKDKNILPVMSMIGDIAMGDKERMKSITLAFAEASSTGKLTGRQNLMFRTALFNPLTQLAEMTHKSVPALEKDMEKGKISIDMVVKAMEHATGPAGRWHDMMKKMQDTPAGKWTAFTGTLSTLAGTIGLQLLPALGGLTDFMSGIINNGPLLENVGVSIGVMTAAWILYTAWVERAAIWSGILEAAAYWPLAAVGLLAYAFNDLKKLNTDYADNTASTANNVADSFTFIRRCFETLVYWTELAILHVESMFERFNKFNEGLHTLNFGKMGDAFAGETEAGKKLDKLKLNREWHLAMDYDGRDDDGKKKGSSSPLNILEGGKYTPGKNGGAPEGVSDTASGITGGGVRNLTINIAKQGVDQITIHAATLKEGVEDIRGMFIEMFNQVINSGNAAVQDH